MEVMQKLRCLLKLLAAVRGGCACCPARRSSSARVAARRAERAGRAGRVLKNLLLPLKTPRQEAGRRGAGDSSWCSAQRLACALRACGFRALPCLRSVSSTRARLAHAGCLRQPALAQLSRARRDARYARCTHYAPPRAASPARPSARSLRAFLMSVLAVSPRPRKGLLTLSSLPHQLCQARADGSTRHARDDGAHGDKGMGGGGECEDPCEDVERTMPLMRCRRGARSRGPIRVPGRSRPGGVRPRQSYTSRMGFLLGIRRATAAAAAAGRGERRGRARPRHPGTTRLCAGPSPMNVQIVDGPQKRCLTNPAPWGGCIGPGLCG